MPSLSTPFFLLSTPPAFGSSPLFLSPLLYCLFLPQLSLTRHPKSWEYASGGGGKAKNFSECEKPSANWNIFLNSNFNDNFLRPSTSSSQVEWPFPLILFFHFYIHPSFLFFLSSLSLSRSLYLSISILYYFFLSLSFLSVSIYISICLSLSPFSQLKTSLVISM